jgi:hypothetical protein
VGGWISQSDEIVKDHTSCDDFSACVWPLVQPPREHPVLYSVVYIRFTLNQSFSFYCEFGLIVLFVISIRF